MDKEPAWWHVWTRLPYYLPLDNDELTTTGMPAENSVTAPFGFPVALDNRGSHCHAERPGPTAGPTRLHNIAVRTGPLPTMAGGGITQCQAITMAATQAERRLAWFIKDRKPTTMLLTGDRAMASATTARH